MTQPGLTCDAAFSDAGIDYEVHRIDVSDAGDECHYVIETADTMEQLAAFTITAPTPLAFDDLAAVAKAHLNSIRATLKPGDKVRIGDLLAELTAVGNTTSFYVRFADGEEGSYPRSRMAPHAILDPHA